jgi:hypothetical protein
MFVHRLLRLAVATTTLVAAGPSMAVIAYSESVSGDLSNTGQAPTAITFVLGDNDVLGASGIPATGPVVDFRDYGTFVVPQNMVLTAITVLAGTMGAENGELFLGLESGPVMTTPPTIVSPSQAPQLKWTHFNEFSAGSTLLTGYPMAAGAYSFWIQDFNQGTAPYNLRFSVAAVPEPGTSALLLAGCGLLGLVAGRRRPQGLPSDSLHR